MTEREKQLSGLPYDGTDPELVSLQFKARNLAIKLNNLSPEKEEEKNELIMQLFENARKNLRLIPPVRVDFGCNIFLGDNVFINQNCTFLDNNKITIGDRTMLAPDVKIYAGDHPLEGKIRRYSTADGKAYIVTSSKPVVIGADVWIGGGSIILPGVTIGNNVVIGAGSVVTKDIPDNCVAVGNPCRVIKKLIGLINNL